MTRCKVGDIAFITGASRNNGVLVEVLGPVNPRGRTRLGCWWTRLLSSAINGNPRMATFGHTRPPGSEGWCPDNVLTPLPPPEQEHTENESEPVYEQV